MLFVPFRPYAAADYIREMYQKAFNRGLIEEVMKLFLFNAHVHILARSYYSRHRIQEIHEYFFSCGNQGRYHPEIELFSTTIEEYGTVVIDRGHGIIRRQYGYPNTLIVQNDPFVYKCIEAQEVIPGIEGIQNWRIDQLVIDFVGAITLTAPYAK